MISTEIPALNSGGDRDGVSSTGRPASAGCGDATDLAGVSGRGGAAGYAVHLTSDGRQRRTHDHRSRLIRARIRLALMSLKAKERTPHV
jgi:hypothetical protein